MLSLREVEKLGAILSLLDSDQDGEILAAAAAARRFMAGRGIRWPDLAAPLALPPPGRARPTPQPDPPQTDWRELVAWARAHPMRWSLNDWQRDFLVKLPGFVSISTKQRASLSEIVTKLRRTERTA